MRSDGPPLDETRRSTAETFEFHIEGDAPVPRASARTDLQLRKPFEIPAA
jgi:hypothetical protein